MESVIRASFKFAKNSANCVKFICKKQCEMCEISMQKTVRIASNLYAKNSAKCVNFLQILRCFLQITLAHFSVVFAGKLAENWMAILYIFKLFRDDFYVTVCRDGKGGISVKSRSNCGNPDRDCTENTRFCSAVSTKSEIVKVMPEKRLTPHSNRNPPV